MATGLVSGLMIGSYLSHPDRQPVLRGYKIALPQVFVPDREAGEEAGLSSYNPEASGLMPLPDVPDSITRWTDEENPPEPPRLNLSLPDMDWDSMEWKGSHSAFPNFFRPGQDARMNVSGRLHWDESEEAETRPIQDTILGAEVELQWRLP